MTLFQENENYQNNLRESDDDYHYPINKRNKYETLDKQINEIDYELEKIKPKQFNLNIDRNELKKTLSSTNQIGNKQHSQIYEVQDKLYSLLMKEPIIKRENFWKSLSKTINKKEMSTLNLKLLDYSILKEIIDTCGSFPEKSRNYIWKFLLSLPCDKNLFEFYSSKGIHPYYKNLSEFFPVKEKKDFLRLQQMCSVISFWSPQMGNVFFLPNLIFPFIKSIHGDDLFLFEVIIAFLNTFCQFWFEFYPGAPLNHLKICEKIIQKESPKLYSHLKNLENEFNTSSMKISELVWRLLKNIFSEILCRENFLQMIDFILTYNHRPEILLYISCSILMNLENVLLKCESPQDVDNLLFDGIRNYKNLNLNLMKIFKNSLKIYDKYSKFQIYKYKPYIPFPDGKYPIANFPLDFLGTTAKLREELFMEEENFKIKQKQIDEIEEKFVELSRREKMMQRCYESLIHKEKEKGEIKKRELDLLIYQKQKFYEELKNRKIEKINKLENIIDTSLKFYQKMKSTELITYEEEMRKKKDFEEFDIKQRLQQEELNNLEFDVNRKMLQLMNIRSKDEEERKFRNLEENNEKEREMKKRLMEEKWKLEDEAMKKKLEYLRNMKEFEYLQNKEGNEILKKDLRDKILEYEEDLLIREVERERMNRMIEQEYEENKFMKSNINQINQSRNQENDEKPSDIHSKKKYGNQVKNAEIMENKSKEIVRNRDNTKTPINSKNYNNAKVMNSKHRKDPNEELISIKDECNEDNLDNINNRNIYFNNENDKYDYNDVFNNKINNGDLREDDNYNYNYSPNHGKTTQNYLNNNYNNNNRIPVYSTSSNQNEFSSPNLSSENKYSTQTNLRLINEGIRNLTSSSSAQYNNYYSTNLSKFDVNSTSKEETPVSFGLKNSEEGKSNKIKSYNLNNNCQNQNDTHNDLLTSSYKSENEENSNNKIYESKNSKNIKGNNQITSPKNGKNYPSKSDSLFSLSKSKNITSLDSLSLSDSNG